jgi:hypothetical protein
MSIAHEHRYVGNLVSTVIEVQHDRVSFAAVDAGMLDEVREHATCKLASRSLSARSLWANAAPDRPGVPRCGDDSLARQADVMTDAGARRPDGKL